MHIFLITESFSSHTEFPIIPPNAAEIESIVRRVLATLAHDATSRNGLLPSSAVPVGRLSLADPVVSAQSLKNRLEGIQLLEIGTSSVMTPAAKDLCKELGIEIVRQHRTPPAKHANSGHANSDKSAGNAPRPSRLLVAGPSIWLGAMAKQLCSEQVQMGEPDADDSSVLRSISNGVRAGHQAGVAIVQSPHAVCWQAARDDRLRPAVVSHWNDLNDVLREVPANLLILSARTWNIPSACNGVRRFFQHLQNHS